MTLKNGLKNFVRSRGGQCSESTFCLRFLKSQHIEINATWKGNKKVET